MQTAALLAAQAPNMHFVIFGQGRMRDAVLQAAERERISHRIILAGVTNDVLSAMSIMDVFLLTSFGEGLPNVLLEAQWVGTPVVVTDVGGAKEALDPEVTGWAIDTDDPHHLAARIKWLHDNPAMLQAIRIKGPQWVRQHSVLWNGRGNDSHLRSLVLAGRVWFALCDRDESRQYARTPTVDPREG